MTRKEKIKELTILRKEAMKVLRKQISEQLDYEAFKRFEPVVVGKPKVLKKEYKKQTYTF